MKKYIYSLIAFLTLVVCQAQVALSQAEYFWDTDPGVGLGVAVTAVDGSFNSAFEQMASNGIAAPSVGMHKFSIRVKDNTGVWGTVFTTIIKVEQTLTPTPLSLTQAEFFWDTDPGEGNATTVLATDGNYDSAFEQVSKSGIAAPSVGLHTFNIRIKDNNTTWSPVFTNIIKVEQTETPVVIKLSQAEYFWDTDPGEGSGTTVLATDGNFDTTFENLSKTGIAAPSVGMHKFNIRVKDADGVWSPVFTNIINVEQTQTPVAITLSQAEYFWDTDPGEGSGTALLATDGNFNSAFEQFFQNGIPIAQPVGLHVFNVRVKDNTGVWSPVFKNVIYIETALCTTPVPTAAATQFFCVSGTVANLTATGTSLQWYSDSTGGSALPATTALATGSYYVSQTIGVCESLRAPVSVTVSPIVTPSFTQVAPVCSGSVLAVLPITSANGINGSWSPAVNNLATTTYTFTPSAGQCASTTTMTITVNPIVTPSFTQVAPVCSGSVLAVLPITSVNGINGSWSPAVNNLATTTYTFTPSVGQCASTTTMTITVNPIVTPSFTQVAPVCSGATLSALPVSSTNGINGSWSPAINNLQTTIYTFTPTAGQCASTTTMTITVSPVVLAPTGNANQTFCLGEIIGNLNVIGTLIVWYDAPSLGNIITNNTPLIAGTTYYASQTLSSCESNLKLSVTVTLGSCLSNENFEIVKLMYFPNPVIDFLNLSFDEKITSVSVLNLLGQEVISTSVNLNETKIDMTSLPSATYLVKIFSNFETKLIKVIKK